MTGFLHGVPPESAYIIRLRAELAECLIRVTRDNALLHAQMQAVDVSYLLLSGSLARLQRLDRCREYARKGHAMMSLNAYLLRLFLGHGEVSKKLDLLLTQQRKMMANFADLTAQIDRQNAATATIAAAQTEISTAVSNVAADIQKLIGQIGSGTPGLTAEEADAALALLTNAADTLSGVATSLTETAASLNAVAATVPEEGV